MSSVTVNGIKDFQMCERLYDYRYIELYPEKVYSRDLYTNKFENTIKNIIYFFFFKKQGGIIPSYSALLNRWEKMWFPKDTTSYDIITEQHETAYGNLASLTSKAAGILLSFYDQYSDAELIPMGIAEEYSVPGKHKLNIEDKFDLLLYKNGEFLITKILFNYKNSNKHLYHIDFCAMQKGFENRHPTRISKAKFGYIDIMSPNINFNEYIITEEDVKSFEYWFDKIATTEIFAPKRNLIPYCKKCPFDKPCSKWTGWTSETTK